MKKRFKKTMCLMLGAILTLGSLCSLSSCGKNEEKIIIYTSSEDYIVEFMQKKLDEKFPNYDIVIEYKPTGDHAAILKSAGKNAGCHISHDIEYTYAEQIAASRTFADLKDMIDFDIYSDDVVKSTYFAPEIRNGGAIILNMEVIREKGLDIPKSYEDLLDPQYKGLISMPNPKASGTGYMFLLSLINTWGEDKAFDYFDKLSDNILSFTSSGSGPVNALVGKEVAVGLGMTYTAAKKIADGEDLKIVYFDEGSPFSLYGMSIISGYETNEAVLEVFKYLAGDLNKEKNELFGPEKLYKDLDLKVENYPDNIVYANMENDTPERKEQILSKWNH